MNWRIVSKVRRIFDEVRKVRNPRQAWEFVEWLGGAVGRRLVAGFRGRPGARNIGEVGGVSHLEDRGKQEPGGVAGDLDRRSDREGSGAGDVGDVEEDPGVGSEEQGAGSDVGEGEVAHADAPVEPGGGSKSIPEPNRAVADYPLGAEIVALGARAAAVFAASGRVGHSLDDEYVDLVVVDSPDDIETTGPPMVALADLAPHYSVPAFDPLTINPTGWVRKPTAGTGVLGPPDLLPPGTETHQVVSPHDRDALHVLHHLEDVAEFHPDVMSRASTLATVAAMGVVVHLADQDAALERFLGRELYGLMAASDILSADRDGRERISVAMRRVALRDHSLRRRSRDLIAAALPDPPLLPKVSILAPTKRPQLVHSLLDTVAGQTYPRLELVLILHGEGFGHDVEVGVADAPYPVRVVCVGGELSLGSALNSGVSVASGTLLSKFDDDDVYAADHVWDLVLAHEYSGAALVAKGAEFVYLSGSDVTLHRFCGKGETSSRVPIAGATILVSRHALDTVGGWKRLPLGEDRALIEDVRRAGGQVYRTHGFGFVVVRHGKGHTWDADDDYFLRQAEQVRQGWDPGFAGLDPRYWPAAARMSLIVGEARRQPSVSLFRRRLG